MMGVDSNHVTRAQLAAHLHCAPSWVTQLEKAGRLVLDAAGNVLLQESLALIEATRGNRPDVAARHAERRLRKAGPPRPATQSPVEAANELAALADGEFFDALQADLRAALRAVPFAQRDDVVMPESLWHRLVGDATDDVLEAEGFVRGGMEETDLQFMSDFWYSLAAGEIFREGDRLLVTPAAARLFEVP